VLPVHGQVSLIAGAGGHVAVQVGPEGVLVVNTGAPGTADALLGVVRSLSKRPITYVVNTTPYPEYYSGNQTLSAAGRNPAVPLTNLGGRGAALDSLTALSTENIAPVIAHERMMRRLDSPARGEPEVPIELWPTNTFFTDKKTLSFNDEAIELRHQQGITDGDLIVFFRKSDVVVAGEIINSRGYPKFDPSRGGSLQGEIDALNAIIDITVPRFNQQGGTRVIPGHGRVMNEVDVADYRDMCTIIRDRVKLAVERKMTLAELRAQQPTLDYDGLYSTPAWTGEMFVEAIYKELAK
jgi:glyoxylase-like metal-dependent hydrolase (beta-lactamase superfamily II)